MSVFVDNVSALLKEKHITKNKMLSDLHLSKNSFVDWNKRGTIPSAVVVSSIAEYLGTSVSCLMGKSSEDFVSSSSLLSSDESRLLKLYKSLNCDNQTILMAEAIKLQRQQDYEQAVETEPVKCAK